MNPTSALLVIGNEILSGRTQDANIRFLAQRMGEIGCPLREVRVVPDVRETIIGTVTEMRARYDEVFTTGGIGPTHDDITAACIAEVFGVPLEVHAESFSLLEAHFAAGEFNAARQRMAMLPRGATPIRNPVSVAPGFSIGNVHVMAGVPSIMRGMFGELVSSLKHGEPVLARAWHAQGLLESVIAERLSAIQDRFAGLDIGSYPFRREDGRRGVALVAKGTDVASLDAVAAEIHDLIVAAGFTPIEGEPPA